MSINFAAVHKDRPWRKHSIHQTLHAAIDGKDGAKNLLLRVGRVAGMWDKHGDVQCVFVWEDGANSGKAFRLDPAKSSTIQEKTLEISKILGFHRNKGCTDKEIAECFEDESKEIAANAEGSSNKGNKANAAPRNHLYPDELDQDINLPEGTTQQVTVNRFERSAEARVKCISHYGASCQVCGMNFGQKYGEIGVGFIHVHHRTPIATIGKEYVVNPIDDLIPVCPNCHAILHRKEPPLTIAELKKQLNNG